MGIRIYAVELSIYMMYLQIILLIQISDIYNSNAHNLSTFHTFHIRVKLSIGQQRKPNSLLPELHKVFTYE